MKEGFCSPKRGILGGPASSAHPEGLSPPPVGYCLLGQLSS